MLNIEQELTGNTLTLTIDLSQTYGKSKSGKNIIIASTQGNVKIEGKEGVMMGVNIYKKAL